MLILIAESKTMAPCDAPTACSSTAAQLSCGEKDAAMIMRRLLGMNVAQLADATGISAQLAARLHTMAYDFPNKTAGGEAIRSFTGVVFKAFGYDSLSPDAKLLADKRLRILSSLYGLLRPGDIIKPYRLEFTARVAPGDETMARFLKSGITAGLVEELKAGHHTDVINMLPGDAAKAVDWRAIRDMAGVWTVDFREVIEGGSLRTPRANLLKKLRGHLLRSIMERGADTPGDIADIETDLLLPQTAECKDGHIVFHV